MRPRWEVGGGLTKKPIQFSLATVAQMMRIHDSSRNNAGTITFADFTSLHMLLKSFSETFHRHDVNKAGRLNLQQVQQAVQAVGHMLDEAAFLAVSRSFDPTHTWVGITTWGCRSSLRSAASSRAQERRSWRTTRSGRESSR